MISRSSHSSLVRQAIFSLCLLPLFAEAISYLKVGEDKAITVLNGKAAAELHNGEEKPALYDLLTGILISSSAEGKEYEISEEELTATSALYDEVGKKVAVVIGIERRNDGKILPFGYVRLHFIDAPLDSGTFLFNEKKELVAALYLNNGKQGFATPIKAILRGAEDFQKNGKISLARIGIITSESDTVPEVLSVRPDEPASKAGIKKGDFLLSVGDHAFSNYLEMREAFYYLIDGKKEKISVLRDGVKMDLTITPVAKD